MTSPLAIESRIFAELRERTKAEHNVEDGDPFLEGSLEGATRLPEEQAAVSRKIVLLEKRADGVRSYMNNLDDFACRLEAQAGKYRAALSQSMQEAGQKRVPQDALPEMTVTLSEPKKKRLKIDDDKLVPNMFRQPKPQEFSINRDALQRWLEDGGVCEGAHLRNAQPILTIRS